MSVGLVLSGGGAKGAYQVGVVNALVELGTDVGAVAGASIGALNGAVLAASPSLAVGAQRLSEVWGELAAESPLEANTPNYFHLLLSAGIVFHSPFVDALFSSVVSMIPVLGLPVGVATRSVVQAAKSVMSHHAARMLAEHGALSTRPLDRMMDKYLNLEDLARGLPLYVSAYPTQSLLRNIAGIIKAELGLGDNVGSEFFHVQALDSEEQKGMLLASAAIPLLFGSQTIAGKKYSDGGQGGWRSVQGNTPIQPLLDAGYRLIIVTHLSDGSLWSRDLFPDATILEIRPQRPIARSDGLLSGAQDLLGFNAENIKSWIEQGYEDTMHCVGRVREALIARSSLQASELARRSTEDQGISAESAMRDAMGRIIGND